MLARLRGAQVLLLGVGQDSESRLPAAERVGLQTANLSEKPLEEHLRNSFGEPAPDVWIESSGSVRALSSALECARPGGMITVVGLYAEEMLFSPTPAVRAELSLLFSYACNYADYREALDLLGRGAIDPGPLLSMYPLGSASEAFKAVSKGQVVKAMLVP